MVEFFVVKGIVRLGNVNLLPRFLDAPHLVGHLGRLLNILRICQVLLVQCVESRVQPTPSSQTGSSVNFFATFSETRTTAAAPSLGGLTSKRLTGEQIGSEFITSLTVILAPSWAEG